MPATQPAPSAHVVGALSDWRDALSSSGRVGRDALPTDRDLLALAAVDPPSRPAFEKVALDRPGALDTFGAGILMAVRAGHQDAAAGEPVPVLPPGLVAAPQLVRPAPVAAPAPVPPAPTVDVVPAPGRKRRSQTAASAAAAPPTPPAATAPGTSTGPPGQVRNVQFAPHDDTLVTPQALTRVQVQMLDDGSLRISWAAASNGPTSRLYRVVTSDEWRPWSPDSSDLLSVTTDTSALDSRPFTGPVRHVQVWVNEGADQAAASASPATLLAEATAVAPPRQVLLSEDHGTVVGSWEVAPGVHRVEVLRVPGVHASTAGYLPQCLVPTPDDALHGVQDSGCQAGEDYEYRIFAVVVVDGVESRSDAVTRRVTVGGSLEPVREVRWTERRENGRTLVDLEWDQSAAGEVQVFRTDRAPVVGAADAVLPVSSLTQAGLPPAARIPIRPQWADGRGWLSGVPWPVGLPRVHFTTVSVDRTGARVGATATLTRTGAITDVVLRQRVSWQVLTFGWPEGAAEVRVYTGPVGAGLPDPPGQALEQLDQARYRNEGGLRLGRGVLEPGGCDVHLVPVSFFGGQSIVGEPATTNYRGLYRIAYSYQPPEAGRFGGRRGAAPVTKRSVQVIGDQVVPPHGLVLTWQLVANRDRLPLSPSDGTAVTPPRRGPAPGKGGPEQGWTVVDEFDFADHPAGCFVRLFAVADRGTVLEVALLDPALETLQP